MNALSDNKVVYFQKPNGDFVQRFIDTYKSPSTKRNYLTYILDFFHVKNTWEIKIEAVKIVRVIDAQDYLIDAINRVPKLSDDAIKARRNALSSLWQYVIDTYEHQVISFNVWNNTTIKNLLKNNLTKKAKNDANFRILSDEEIETVIDYTKTTNTRDYMLFKVMLNCGLRRYETGAFLWSDFMQHNGEWYINIRPEISKGRKTRQVYVNENLLAELKIFAKENIIGESDVPVFGLCGDSVNRLVRETCHDCGIFDVTAHTLRHTNITNLARKGVELPDLQEHAGHSDPATTMRYIHMVNKFRDCAGKKWQV